MYSLSFRKNFSLKKSIPRALHKQNSSTTGVCYYLKASKNTTILQTFKRTEGIQIILLIKKLNTKWVKKIFILSPVISQSLLVFDCSVCENKALLCTISFHTVFCTLNQTEQFNSPNR